MNTNPHAKRVLCFGDSNTQGRDPKRKVEGGIKTRYPVGVLWTSQLQSMLGEGYEVIEEGLGGRTTNIDDPDDQDKNGLTYLRPCLISHEPVDLVILMLGTNDLKEIFNRTALDIALANKELIETIRQLSSQTKIILVSPPLVDETNPMVATKYKGATEKSKQLGKELLKIAQETGCHFLDLSIDIPPSRYDGIHIDEEYQTKIAEFLQQNIISLFS